MRGVTIRDRDFCAAIGGIETSKFNKIAAGNFFSIPWHTVLSAMSGNQNSDDDVIPQGGRDCTVRMKDSIRTCCTTDTLLRFHELNHSAESFFWLTFSETNRHF